MRICPNILSFGAGVNSTAILCLHKQGKVQLDAVIFADTGAEHPETYSYIEQVVKPFCKELDLPFIIVGSPTLFEDYWNKKIIPYRLFRSCTDRYKIQPIKKYVKTNYGETIIILGIDSGEKHRAKYTEGFSYPLIELGINREQCKSIIIECGLQIPRKSGCYFCPFTNSQEWKNLLQQHEDLYMKAEAFEKNCRAYPTYHLSNKTLESMRKAIQNQKTLCDFDEGESCVFCHQ
jgi:3'-phosphoadenosine 5'-phosphosulfate sulfotransferase (PAPS reductase)/FAD synthetase